MVAPGGGAVPYERGIPVRETLQMFTADTHDGPDIFTPSLLWCGQRIGAPCKTPDTRINSREYAEVCVYETAECVYGANECAYEADEYGKERDEECV